MLANGCQLYNKEWVKFISGNLHAVWNEFVEPSYSKQSRILVIKRWERYPRYHHFRWVKRISGLCTCQRNGQTWSCHETIDTAIDTHWWQSRIVGFLIWITKSMISSPFLDDRILQPGDLPSPIPPLGSNLWGPMKLGATEHVAGYVPGRMEKSAMLVMGCCHKYVKGKATEQVICGVTSVSHEKKSVLAQGLRTCILYQVENAYAFDASLKGEKTTLWCLLCLRKGCEARLYLNPRLSKYCCPSKVDLR